LSVGLLRERERPNAKETYKLQQISIFAYDLNRRAAVFHRIFKSADRRAYVEAGSAFAFSDSAVESDRSMPIGQVRSVARR